jgi:hypothetical protein
MPRGAAIALAVCLWSASSAWAGAPTGDYAVFAQCPTSTAGVKLCIEARVESGRASFDGLNVPITRAIMLQGGIIRNEETEAEAFAGAVNGQTFSKSPQAIPGGLQGLVAPAALPRALREPYGETAGIGFGAVAGTIELAGAADTIGIDKNNIVNETGIGLSLPLKIRLENPLLGGACYIGSSANPIVWNLTTGETEPPPPNTPLKGNVGDLEFKDEGRLLEMIGGTLVDNAYAAPVANGCAGPFSSLVDPLLDAKTGLPAAAGRNSTTLRITVKEALVKTVVNSEK